MGAADDRWYLPVISAALYQIGQFADSSVFRQHGLPAAPKKWPDSQPIPLPNGH